MNTILLILCNALSCFIISTILFQFMNGKYKCIWRILTAGFAEQNGRNAKLNGRITFDY